MHGHMDRFVPPETDSVSVSLSLSFSCVSHEGQITLDTGVSLQDSACFLLRICLSHTKVSCHAFVLLSNETEILQRNFYSSYDGSTFVILEVLLDI